jgi:uracil-DNA glycosylase
MTCNRISAARGGPAVFSSYHCSRYNTNTGRLTEAMFTEVFEAAVEFVSS